MGKHYLAGSRLFISLLALVLIVSLLLTACGTTTSTTTQESTITTQTSTTTTKTSTTTTTTSAQKVLKIGAVIDMTGAKGLQTKKWYDLMANLYNDAGGWKIGNDTYKVQMVLYDTQGNLTTAKDELTRLVLQDGVKFVIGYSVTSSADVDNTVTEPNKVIVFTEDLTNQGGNPKYNYYYSTGNIFQYSVVTADMVRYGIKSYVSVKPDNQVGRVSDTSSIASWKLADPNIDYKGTVWVATNTIDWGPIATKIKSYNADCADLTMLGTIANAVPNTYRALYDANFKGVILPGQMTQAILDNLVVTVGKAAIEGGEVPVSDPYTWQQEPRMRSLMEAYVKAYGKWENDATNCLNGFFALEAAINATQSVDVEVIKAYMDNSPAPCLHLGGITKYFARPELGNYRTVSACFSTQSGLIRDGKLVASGNWATDKGQYLRTIKMKNMIDTYKAYWEQYGYPTFPAAEKGFETFHFTDLGITGHD
jgi:branched-chain amino acid transport system substrate-binding protein